MANNRMMLVNMVTGQRVLIAKHLADAWSTNDLDTLHDQINSAFEAEVEDHGAAWGSTAWRIEYEHDEPELDAALKETCNR